MCAKVGVREGDETRRLVHGEQRSVIMTGAGSARVPAEGMGAGLDGRGRALQVWAAFLVPPPGWLERAEGVALFGVLLPAQKRGLFSQGSFQDFQFSTKGPI